VGVGSFGSSIGSPEAGLDPNESNCKRHSNARCLSAIREGRATIPDSATQTTSVIAVNLSAPHLSRLWRLLDSAYANRRPAYRRGAKPRLEHRLQVADVAADLVVLRIAGGLPKRNGDVVLVGNQGGYSAGALSV
jgi:hypothetical protein